MMAAPGTVTHVLEVAAALKTAADTHAESVRQAAAVVVAPPPPAAPPAPAPAADPAGKVAR